MEKNHDLKIIIKKKVHNLKEKKVLKQSDYKYLIFITMIHTFITKKKEKKRGP